MHKYLGSFILGAALLTPTLAVLTPAAGAQDRDHRYYDRDRKDYHNWNEAESRAYRHWIQEERHERYRDFARLSKAQQRAYWRWRHEHSDWH